MNTNHARQWQSNYAQPSHHEKQQKRVVVKVRSKSWLTKGEKIIYAFLCMLLLVSGIFIVSFSSTTDTLNRDMLQLKNEIHQQQLKNEGLTFEVRELSKPERITKIAKENGLKIQDTKVKQATN